MRFRKQQSIKLETPVQHNMLDHPERKKRTFLIRSRRLVETVINKLAS